MDEIIIATQNKGKIKEFKDFFDPFNIRVLSLLDLEETPEIEETGKTFRENAKIKAEEIANHLNAPVLADDSGLEVHALNGEPGIYSARYAGEAKRDEDNNAKLLNELKDIPEGRRDARFVCVLAISIPGEETIYYDGFCEGKIAFLTKGNEGFGYDPIFIPKGYQKTMAELSSEEKNQISHRKQAFKQLKSWGKLTGCN